MDHWVDVNLLFEGPPALRWLAERRRVMRGWVADLSPETLAETSDGELVERAMRTAWVEPVALDANAACTDEPRWLGPQQGIEVVTRVPFRGDDAVFLLQPTAVARHLNLRTEVRIVGSEVHVRWRGTAKDESRLSAEVSRSVALIGENLAAIDREVERHNGLLDGLAREALAARREEAGVYSRMVESLGLPLRRRPDASSECESVVERKPEAETSRAFLMAPQGPIPELTEEGYEQLLLDLRRLAEPLEGSPRAFAGMSEESLRWVLLVALNALYEGVGAGEAFGGEGRTGIVARWQGHNVLAVECKGWRGGRALTQVTDELLGRATRPETRLALVLLSRGRRLATVVRGVRQSLAEHAAFVREEDTGHEWMLRHVVAHPDDPEARRTLTVIVLGSRAPEEAPDRSAVEG